MKHSTRAYNGRLFFDHLPKTAGTAVSAWLRNELGSGCVTDKLEGNHQELAQFGGDYSIISGHLKFNGEGLDPRYEYMTLFRDPIDRVFSYLFFVLERGGDGQASIWSRSLFPWVEEFVASGGRQLNDGLRSYISDMYTNHFISVENNFSSGISAEKKMLMALEVIKSYDVVGLYEEMPEFLADVAELVGIPAPKSIARMNITRSKPALQKISPELRQRIIDLNQLDVRLYNEVVAWKKSQPPKERKNILASPWQKYEPVRERVFTTPDLPDVRAVLREGADVIHGQLLAFDVDFLLTRQVCELEAGIHIFDENRNWAFGTNSNLLGKVYRDISAGSHRITHHLIADLPAGKYTAGFSFAERLLEGNQQELAWYSVLCEFRVNYDVSLPFVGYCCLPAEITLQPTALADDSLIVNNPVGSIVPIGLFETMKANEVRTIRVTVSNTGKQLWLGDCFRPVNLSYHWYDQTGTPVIYEGLRTRLPEGGIAPSSTVEMWLAVHKPEKLGRYVLELTLVQELVGWFEEKGFVSYKVEVDVVAAG